MNSALERSQWMPSRLTSYFYDVEFPGQPGDPPLSNTWSNRLLWSTSTGGAMPDETKASAERTASSRRCIISA